MYISGVLILMLLAANHTLGLCGRQSGLSFPDDPTSYSSFRHLPWRLLNNYLNASELQLVAKVQQVCNHCSRDLVRSYYLTCELLLMTVNAEFIVTQIQRMHNLSRIEL